MTLTCMAVLWTSFSDIFTLAIRIRSSSASSHASLVFSAKASNASLCFCSGCCVLESLRGLLPPLPTNNNSCKTSIAPISRALCRMKLLPVTHVLVDIWMLTVKPVHKLKMYVFDLEKDYKHTCDTIYMLTFKASLTISMVLEDLFLLLHFLSVYHPSTHISTCPYSFLPVQMTGGQITA